MILRAQVGHTPQDSPYRDVSTSARLSVYGGWYVAAKDEAGVMPKSGPLTGVRLDVHVGGPADLAIRIARVGSKRNVIDPTRSQGDRLVDVQNVNLGFADIGLSFNLTGGKSWHNFMPTVNGGVGMVSDFKGRDAGGFQHGSTFAVAYGLGIRYLPLHSRLALRGDLGSYLYSIQYPTTYYTIGGDGTSVLSGSVNRSQWRNNWTMSFGAAYRLYK